MHVLEALHQIQPLSQEARDVILDVVEESHHPKGHHLLNFWEIDHYLHFVVKGSGRVYYLREGLDVTDYIALDGQFLGGVSSVFTQKPSHKAIVLTEASQLQSIRFSDFERLSATSIELANLGRRMMTWAFLECQERIESIRFLSVRERYEALEEKYPGISNRIPLKHLASYLGTTQVSLSRIRSGVQ